MITFVDSTAKKTIGSINTPGLYGVPHVGEFVTFVGMKSTWPWRVVRVEREVDISIEANSTVHVTVYLEGA